MSQTSKLSKNNTKVTRTDNATIVTLYKTDIVTHYDDNKVVLNTGGWNTATTRTRINQYANENDLGFGVSQRKGTLYLCTAMGDTPFTGESIEFHL